MPGGVWDIRQNGRHKRAIYCNVLLLLIIQYPLLVAVVSHSISRCDDTDHVWLYTRVDTSILATIVLALSGVSELWNPHTSHSKQNANNLSL